VIRVVALEQRLLNLGAPEVEIISSDEASVVRKRLRAANATGALE
jgi:hypothetical protein